MRRRFLVPTRPHARDGLTTKGHSRSMIIVRNWNTMIRILDKKHPRKPSTLCSAWSLNAASLACSRRITSSCTRLLGFNIHVIKEVAKYASYRCDDKDSILKIPTTCELFTDAVYYEAVFNWAPCAFLQVLKIFQRTCSVTNWRSRRVLRSCMVIAHIRARRSKEFGVLSRGKSRIILEWTNFDRILVFSVTIVCFSACRATRESRLPSFTGMSLPKQQPALRPAQRHFRPT